MLPFGRISFEFLAIFLPRTDSKDIAEEELTVKLTTKIKAKVTKTVKVKVKVIK